MIVLGVVLSFINHVFHDFLYWKKALKYKRQKKNQEVLLYSFCPLDLGE